MTLLIERFDVLYETARYTVKRCINSKVYAEVTGKWKPDRIGLEPLNPEFEPWDVEPENFAMIADWQRVID